MTAAPARESSAVSWRSSVRVESVEEGRGDGPATKAIRVRLSFRSSAEYPNSTPTHASAPLHH